MIPAWWSRKSKCKPKPESASAASCSSSPRTKPDPELYDEAPNPNLNPKSKLKKSAKKEKANSFDEAFARKAAGGLSPINGSAVGHPLPQPVSAPLPSNPHDVAVAVAGSGPGSASASASSVSSSGSDETPDLGFYRYSYSNTLRGRNPTHAEKHQFAVNTVFEHRMCANISTSPKESHLFCLDTPTHHRSSTDNIFSTANGQRGHPLPTSPMHPRALGICPGSPKLRQDDLKSPPHPLPLPPSSPRSSSSSRPSVPSQWKKGKLLGRGTFGHVYLGFNSESGQMCAIKEVEVISDDSNSKECLRQLNQEITLLSQLSHPNIVRYYESELADDTLSVYLEYVSGGSIHKLLQEYGPFREPVIRSYTRQILSGLSYLHGRNTVHRDIKGANILVGPNGEIKLADFGMAKHISAYTSIRSFKGSPYWMAPEVIMNHNGYNLPVDIWSLGCTILEMATSKPPWSQYEGVPAIFKIANSKEIPDIPDHLSPDAKSFLMLCLQRDPASRPTAAQLMDHPFVRDQNLTKLTKSSVFRDMLPALSAGTQRMATLDLSPNRSISPLRDRDYGVGHLVEFPLASRNQSDQLSMRMNLSLPVSPCSSPLRQFKQTNRSCLPSPPHTAYSAGAVNYDPNNFSLYHTRACNNLDQWPDIPQLKAQTPPQLSPYGSPRRQR